MCSRLATLLPVMNRYQPTHDIATVSGVGPFFIIPVHCIGQHMFCEIFMHLFCLERTRPWREMALIIIMFD